jgi:3-hydroxybutyryl-CoA dehydrogenase
MNPGQEGLVVGVVGAGAMGRGIAQVAAAGGCCVRLHDNTEGAALNAHKFIATMLNRAAEKGRMSADDASAAIGRIEIIPDLNGFAGCDVVIEAVVENLDVKRQVFRAVEAVVGKETVLATNTSSLSVTSIAADCTRPERLAGFHFFNPVPVMKLVEVIAGARTAPEVCVFLSGLGTRLGRTPVRVADVPGFLVNQVGRGYTIEAAHLVGENVARPVDVDRIMRDAAGFRMGPFELLDLTALDVTHPATEQIYRQFFDEPRYRPSTLMKTRMDAGLLGRKTGQGFYLYRDNKQQVPEEADAPAYDGRPVWVSKAGSEAGASIAALIRDLGGHLDEAETPGQGSLIVVAPLGGDATTAAVDGSLDPTRTIAIDTLFGLQGRRTIMTTPVTDPAFAGAAHGLFATDGTPVTMISDSTGFVAQRIVAMIVNIGCSIAQSGAATPEDIDKAVTLGLNYPLGPLGFGDRLGPARILEILETMHALSGDPRYRPTSWLRRRAKLGIPLLTP